jgi:DNA repair protein RadC
MRDVPAADRPRERLTRLGPGALADVELLAVVLGAGTRGADSLRTAAELVRRFPDLRRLAGAGIGELSAIPGVGPAQACRVKAALALAGRLGERPLVRGERLSGPEAVHRRVGRPLAALDREVFLAIALDVKHRVLGEARVAEGGACSVEVQPRDAFTTAVREGAAAVIFVHNHPSGDPSPSGADRALTERLRRAGELIGVAVLDHVIVAQNGWFAFSSEPARPP